MGATFSFGSDSVQSPADDASREKGFGCYNKFCWVYCSPTSETEGAGKTWCYSANPDQCFLSIQYEPCKTDDDCNVSWGCSGPCAAI